VPTQASFDYAILRIVPRVERQEFLNAGVIVLCRERRFLAARIQVDQPRLKALWPDLDLVLVTQHLQAVLRICKGDASAGPIAGLSQSERFHWLTSPRSTVLQVSPVHTGICSQTDDLVERLYTQLVG
jgi:hypothetical protein